MERIFRCSWQYVGHLGELQGPGSYFASATGPVPIVITLDGDGELRGFVNVCRHRGAIVATDAGEAGHAPVPVPRLDLRSRRLPAGRSARRRGSRVRRRPPGAGAGLGRDLGTVRVRQSGSATPSRSPTRSATCPRSSPSTGSTSTRCGSTGGCHYEIQRQLEDRDRELPRVLPLPGQPSGPCRGDRRAPARAARRRAAGQPVRAGAPALARWSRADRRARRAGLGPDPPVVPEHEVQRAPRPPEPLDRAAVAHRSGDVRGLSRLLVRRDTPTRVDRRRCSSSTSRSAPRTRRWSRRPSAARRRA